MNHSINETTNFTNRLIKNELISDELGLYKVPFQLVICLSCFYGCVSLCAIISNLIIVWIVSKSSQMQNATNYLIANLALADILIGAFAIPFQFQAALLQQWNLPWYMCTFCPTVQVISVNVSVFTLTVIALDRYRAVLYPLTARTNKLRIRLIIISIWVSGIIFSIPTFVAYEIETFRDDSGSDLIQVCQNTGLSKTFILYNNHMLVCIQYVVPLVIISFAYLKMGIYLHQNNRMVFDDANSSRFDNERFARNKRKVKIF